MTILQRVLDASDENDSFRQGAHTLASALRTALFSWPRPADKDYFHALRDVLIELEGE